MKLNERDRKTYLLPIQKIVSIKNEGQSQFCIYFSNKHKSSSAPRRNFVRSPRCTGLHAQLADADHFNGAESTAAMPTG